MKKTKAILLILSIITFILIIAQITVNAENTYAGDTYIDSPANTTVEGKMRVNGWYMTNDENAEVRIYIDGQEVKKTLEKRESRPDVLQAVTGCGTPEQNPTPGFVYIIEDDIKIGNHNVEIRIYSHNGDLLAKHSQHFYYAGYKATTYIENPAQNGEVITTNSKMWGWYMSNDEDAEIRILVDNVEQEIEIKRNVRTDVISAIKGYGTEQENPTPGYEFSLDIANISEGEHTLTVQIKSHDGRILAQDVRKIIVNEFVARAYIDHPTRETLVNQVEVNGWVMTNDAQAQIKLYIDGKEANIISEIREDRPDVLNSITGYGDATINPQPGVKYIIDNTGMQEGEHSLTLKVISRKGTVIEEQNEMFYYEKYKAKTYIENPANNGNTISIDNKMWGWVMTNDKNAKLKILIDDIEQEIEIKRNVRTDVISAIKGYGDTKTNPTPGYEFSLDVENITDGEHTLKIQVISEEGQILSEDTRKIVINKYIAKAYIDHPAKETLVNQVEVNGWVMTTDTQAQIKLYIDGEEANIISEIREDRPDVLNAVTGYGDATINPQPGIKYIIDNSKIEEGEHTITVKVISREGNTMEEQNETFYYENYKAKMYIENPENDKETISIDNKIWGWVMTNDKNAQLKILIDDIEQEIEIKRNVRTDVISSIKGYGDIKTNPTPGYEFNLNLENIIDGEHTLKIQVISEEGEVLAEDTKEIIVNKYVARAYIEYPSKEILIDEIKLDGWVMTNDVNSQIKIYVDGKEVNIISEKRENRPDVISAIKGYGDETQNPQPGINYVIDRTGIEAGEHEITLKVISREGKEIAVCSETFKIYKTEMEIESPNTTQISDNQLTVGGWVLSEAKDKKLVIKFDDDIIENVELKSRDDLISLLPEYGGEEVNPTPWFEAVIDFSNYYGIQHKITVQLCLETTGEVLKEEVINVDLINNFKREVITYGYSGTALRGLNGGSELICYKYGEGPNVMFATFCVHGFEDSWWADGEVLVNTANQFYERLLVDKDVNLAKKWTIYIFPEVNPDGRRLGYTNYGPGRTTLYSEAGKGIDINRSWQTGDTYVTYNDDRNYNGTQGFQAYEAMYLRDFLLQHKSQNGQTVLVDLHGWEDQLIGDEEICKYYKTQYPSCRTTGYGRYGTQYLITWARQNLGAKVSLVELPLAHNYSEVVSIGLIEKYIEGTLQMLRGI